MNTKAYRIDLINHSQAFDKDTSPKDVYLIDTWTFRLLDGDSYRDYTRSQLRPHSGWEFDYVTQEAWAEDQQRRTEARKQWDRAVIERITGRPHTLDECSMYTITQVLNDVFCAVRITRFTEDSPCREMTHRAMLMRELEALSDGQLEDALFGKAGDRLYRRLDGMMCAACRAEHGGKCPVPEDADEACPGLAGWLGRAGAPETLITPEVLEGPAATCAICGETYSRQELEELRAMGEAYAMEPFLCPDCLDSFKRLDPEDQVRRLLEVART